MGYTQGQEKELYFARLVIGVIDNAEVSMLMYDGEKEVVKKGVE